MISQKPLLTSAGSVLHTEVNFGAYHEWYRIQGYTWIMLISIRTCGVCSISCFFLVSLIFQHKTNVQVSNYAMPCPFSSLHSPYLDVPERHGGLTTRNQTHCSTISILSDQRLWVTYQKERVGPQPGRPISPRTPTAICKAQSKCILHPASVTSNIGQPFIIAAYETIRSPISMMITIPTR